MRSYRQYCGLARGLDLIGDRWVLLIVRELLPGPRRYGELLDGLPGIATNLLAERLRSMEDNGLVVDRNYAEKAPFAFTGTVKKVVFDVAPHLDDAEEHALHEHASQVATARGIAG